VKPSFGGDKNWRVFVWPIVLCSLSTCLGIGSSCYLTYHEAFVAQGAQEIIASGCWWYPAIGGLPWLEKPPLPFWLVASLGWLIGAVTPAVARVPSVIAAMMLVLGVSLLSSAYYGSTVGIAAGAIQATTAWTVARARLAEADILLACLITWAIITFDWMRRVDFTEEQGKIGSPYVQRWRVWRWVFFSLVGTTSLVKGIGFGAVLIIATVAGVIVTDRDRVARQRLVYRPGWVLVGVLTFAWPVAMIAQHGFRITDLWVLHIAERLYPSQGHGPFAGESWGWYILNVLGQGLPWTPLAVIGAWYSRRGILQRWKPKHNWVMVNGLGLLSSKTRLFGCWVIVPLILVSVTRARNAHYAIHSMIPWSIYAALGLTALGRHMEGHQWPLTYLWRFVGSVFVVLAVGYGFGSWLVAPWVDRHRGELRFYETARCRVLPGEPLVLLYDDWDRDPYPTPFGPVPHDLAVRLYYLSRSACWHFDAGGLIAHGSTCPSQTRCHVSATSLAVIGRERDLCELKELGHVEVLCKCPETRWDRTYVLARVWPGERLPVSPAFQKFNAYMSGHHVYE
jgi:4-amino-4-deoxy-L-arabinose transferase-like glycosyltransferase